MEPGEAIFLIPGVILGRAGPPAGIEAPVPTQEVDSRAVGAALAEGVLQGVGNGRAI